jgi:putative ABC transport system ATP-binding protein
MLKLKAVSFEVESFHRPILKNINLEVHPGDFIVIVGGNGSGKSSLLKLINGLYRPTAGTLHLNHKSMLTQSLEEISQEVVTLTQDLNLSTFANLSVLENFKLACYRHKAVCPQEDELKTYLEDFHPELKNHLHTPSGKLSGGQRQTLALAMALLHPPQRLLLDEHTSALDPKTGHNIMKLSAQQIQHHRITTLMITHELDDAVTYGNRIIALREGELIFQSAKSDTPLNKEDLLHLCF